MANEPKPIGERFGFTGGNLLQAILDKQPDAITEAERDILRARRSYLTPEQIKNYGLDEEVAEKEEEIVETPKVETAKEKKAREKVEKAAAKESKKEK